MKSKIYILTLLLFAFIGQHRLPAQTNVCPTPAGLTATNITANSATVAWATTSASGTYNVRYRTSPSPNTAWLTMTVTTPFANLTGLAAATTYEYQVQRVCSNSGVIWVSAFSPSSYFTTLGITNACPVPVGLFTNNITTNSAKVNWTSTGATSYKVRYRPAGSLAWTTVSASNNFKNLAGLTALTTYQWQVRSICIAPSGVVIKSAFSATATFTTLGVNACPAPTGLTAVAASPNSITLAWGATGAISYNIRYRPANTLAWITTTSTTNSKTITGLISSAAYEWQVQGVCSNGSGAVILSPWSASAYFNYPSPFALSPNPASDKVMLTYEAQFSGEVTLAICDFYNTVQVADLKTATAGNNSFEMNVSNLKNGLYYLQITTAAGRETIKFYVQH